MFRTVIYVKKCLTKMKSKMNQLANKLNKNASLAAMRFLTVALLATTSASAAAEDDSALYVDSVLKWGAWELDIEPAAGGISSPGTKPLNARGTKVALRTNSIAALAPPAPGSGTSLNPVVPGTPVPVPVIPTSPVKPFIPTAPTTPAPPGATPPIVVTLPSSSPPAPTSPAPSGAVTTTVVTLP